MQNPRVKSSSEELKSATESEIKATIINARIHGLSAAIFRSVGNKADDRGGVWGKIFNAVHTVEAKEPYNTVRSYGLRSARKSKKVHGLAPEAGTRTTEVFSLGVPAAPLSLRQFQEKVRLIL